MRQEEQLPIWGEEDEGGVRYTIVNTATGKLVLTEAEYRQWQKNPEKFRQEKEAREKEVYGGA